jgi:putative transposase
MIHLSFKRHRVPPEVIGHAVRLCSRFSLSFRDIEKMLAERGLDVSYETVRSWFLKVSPGVAANFRSSRLIPSDHWRLDERVVTDKLRSYAAAFRSLGLTAQHDRGLRANNRAENAHQPIRRREQKQQRVKCSSSAQRFLNIHAATYDTFYHQRHSIKRPMYKALRTDAFDVRQTASAAA